MKTRILILVAIVFCAFTTSGKTDLNKEIIGQWCNPYTYELSGEVKGFNFKKDGKCEAINIPSLELKTWEIVNGKLIIKGFSIEPDGKKVEYITEERISQLTKDSLSLVTQEANPRLEFLYVRIPVAKKAFPDVKKK